jgi:hypothetical protein
MTNPSVVAGEKNSPTVAHAGRKRRPKLVPRAWGYSWAPSCPGDYKYGGLAFQFGELGNRPTTCHHNQTVRTPNCGLGTVRLSGIDLDHGKSYEMRDEDSRLKCGVVYKQTLINAKVQIGRSGKKNRMTGEVY